VANPAYTLSDTFHYRFRFFGFVVDVTVAIFFTRNGGRNGLNPQKLNDCNDYNKICLPNVDAFKLFCYIYKDLGDNVFTDVKMSKNVTRCFKIVINPFFLIDELSVVQHGHDVCEGGPLQQPRGEALLQGVLPGPTPYTHTMFLFLF
jgi:hypothetical protein